MTYWNVFFLYEDGAMQVSLRDIEILAIAGVIEHNFFLQVTEIATLCLGKYN